MMEYSHVRNPSSAQASCRAFLQLSAHKQHVWQRLTSGDSNMPEDWPDWADWPESLKGDCSDQS